MWADGVHFRIRLEEDRLCCLVIVGVRSDGSKELLACVDGYRESTESWAEVLRLQRPRNDAPVVAVGDGALGFWAALADVFPDTREQRCWVHKTANILDALPKRSPTGQPKRRCMRSTRRKPAGTPKPASAPSSASSATREPKGSRQTGQGPPGAVDLLRLPRRPLGALADGQPHRVDVCHRKTQNQGHQGAGDQTTRAGDR